jgi:hypothetical protein
MSSSLRTRVLAVTIVASLAASASAAYATHVAHARVNAPDALDALDFMTGCWERRAGTRLVEEHWLGPRGGLMLGVSRTTRGDSLLEFEFMRVTVRGDTLVFAAQPSGQPPGEFGGAMIGDRAVRFENAAHDFPQRVIYRAVGTDSLLARVEGTIAGRARAVDFPYRRVACAGGAG